MYILMDYHTTCENCGSSITGIAARHVAENDSPLLSNALIDILDSVEAKKARKGLEELVAEKNWKMLNFSNGVSGHKCPFCGTHQSWENVVPPIRPEQNSSFGIGMIVFLSIIGAVIGMLIGLFLMLLTDSAVTIAISAAVAGVLFALLGISISRSSAKSDAESYPKRLETYEADMKEYNEFQESLKNRENRYEPEVDISSVRLGDMDDKKTEARWPGLNRMI